MRAMLRTAVVVVGFVVILTLALYAQDKWFPSKEQVQVRQDREYIRGLAEQAEEDAAILERARNSQRK